MTQLGPLQRLTGEGSASSILQSFAKIHFLVVVGLKNHLDFWQNSLPCGYRIYGILILQRQQRTWRLQRQSSSKTVLCNITITGVTTHHFWHILLVRRNSQVLPTFKGKRLHKGMTGDECHKGVAFKHSLASYNFTELFVLYWVFFSRSLNIVYEDNHVV